MKRRPGRFACAVLAGAVCALSSSVTTGCVRSARPIGIEVRSTPRFEAEWRKYESFEGYKSMALAGDSDRVYVIGYAHALADQDTAVASALSECEQRRRDRRIEAPCRTIAVGDELVEPSPAGAD